MPAKVHRCVEELKAKGYSEKKAIAICVTSTGEKYGHQESRQLREVVQSTGFKVDREAGVIRDVKVLGHQSLNGREYLPEAIRKARDLYEGCVVNFDHPPRNNPGRETPIADRAGWLENVREQDGLVADLHLLKADGRSEKVMEAGERRPQLFGLSHNVDGKTRRQNGKTLVEEITRVRSVDVVSDPASTRSLFESLEQEEADMATTLTEYLDTVDQENPKVQSLREWMEAGVLSKDLEVDEGMAEKLNKLMEAKKPDPEPKPNPEDTTSATLAKILENQESLQKQLTELKGSRNVQRPVGGQRLTEGHGDEKKSANAQEFKESILAR